MLHLQGDHIQQDLLLEMDISRMLCVCIVSRRLEAKCHSAMCKVCSDNTTHVPPTLSLIDSSSSLTVKSETLGGGLAEDGLHLESKPTNDQFVTSFGHTSS